MFRIAPGEPDQSYLVHKIQGTQATVQGSGQRMPLGGAPLSAEQIGSLQEQFDLIYTLYALHEFDAPARFLTQAKQVLRPAGVLVIMDWVRRAKTGVRESYLAIETVAQCMADAGFNILRQEVCGQTMILVGRMTICEGAVCGGHQVQR